MRKREERVLNRAGLTSDDNGKATTEEPNRGSQKLMMISQLALNSGSVILVFTTYFNFWKVNLLPVSGLGTLYQTRYVIIYILIQCTYKNPAKNFYLCHIDLWIFADIWRRKAIMNSIHEGVITKLENLSIFPRCYGNLFYIKDP